MVCPLPAALIVGFILFVFAVEQQAAGEEPSHAAVEDGEFPGLTVVDLSEAGGYERQDGVFAGGDGVLRDTEFRFEEQGGVGGGEQSSRGAEV